MTIMNDKQIRARSLVPTHYMLGASSAHRFIYAQVKDKIYSVSTGQTLAINHEQALELTTMTPEQQRGYGSPRMITPFEPEQVKTRMVHPYGPNGDGHEEKIISYGLSSFGYDVRLAEDFRIFSNVNSEVADPKRLDERCLVRGELRTDSDGSKYVILPPNSYLLGHTHEEFDIPNDIMVVALGKSTYARSGAIVNVTPIEPGFKGTVVIEISNSTPLPLRIYANEGISQFLFFHGETCEISYAARGGKYNGQQGIVLPKV